MLLPGQLLPDRWNEPGVVLHRIKKRREAGFPPGCPKRGVGNDLVRPRPLPVQCRRSFRRHRQSEKGGEGPVALPLREGVVIDDIIERTSGSPDSASDEMGDRTDGILLMNLVEKPAHPAFIDGGASLEEFLQVDGSSRTVDPGQPEGNAPAFPGKILGFAEEATGLAIRRGGGVFIDDRSVDLTVNAAAARENDGHSGEDSGQIFKAVDEYGPVGVGAPATGTGAVNNHVWTAKRK